MKLKLFAFLLGIAGVWYLWAEYGAASLLCLVPFAIVVGLAAGFNGERKGPSWWHYGVTKR